jgi:DNA ligase D-like protein (predicted 3'-phosphoesterase)
MNYSIVQTDLFGNVVKYPNANKGLKFCLKMHYAEKSGLHYDLRLQIPDPSGKYNDQAMAKSFVLKNGPSMNPHHKPLATMVDDHKVNAFRREGTILRGVGIGAVLHFDEGHFTIPNCNTPFELHKAFQKGLFDGRLTVVFTGHKIKGEFHFYRKSTGKYSQWIIQKAKDSFESDKDILLQNKSILTGNSLQHYLDLFYKQKHWIYKLTPAELDEFIRENDKASFQYKGLELIS